jgi:hypothetical protein
MRLMGASGCVASRADFRLSPSHAEQAAVGGRARARTELVFLGASWEERHGYGETMKSIPQSEAPW